MIFGAPSVGSRRWVFTLAALTAVVALSIDMSLPAQPTLATTFGVSDATTQLTLSAFLGSFALVQLVTGYLSDAWGRRVVLVAGLVVFAIASIACAVAPSMAVLIACRVVQGAGAAAAPVVCRAMVRDTQPAHEAARLLSTMLAVLAIAPMVAPSIGGALLVATSWRAIFVALALLGTIFLAFAVALPETLPVERRRALSFGSLANGYATFFTTPGTKLPMAISCMMFAGQFAYISDSPLVLMKGYAVSERAYGIYFGATAVALMIGSITGGKMIRAGRSPRALIGFGGVLLAIAGIAVAAVVAAGFGIAGFLPSMIVYFFAAGLTGPSATALALEPVPGIAGTASAAIGFSTMTCGVVAGYLTTRIGGESPQTFSYVVLVMGLVSCALTIAAARSHRRTQIL